MKNRYRIVKLINQGGFVAVYRAWDMNLKRTRALKENLARVTELLSGADWLAGPRYPGDLKRQLAEGFAASVGLNCSDVLEMV